MGQHRNISGEARIVGYGMPVAREVADGDVFSVVDDADAAYDQPGVFEPVTAVVPPAPAPVDPSPVTPEA